MRGNHRRVWVGTFQAEGTARVRGPRTMNVRNREASMSGRGRTGARATGNEPAEVKGHRALRALEGTGKSLDFVPSGKLMGGREKVFRRLSAPSGEWRTEQWGSGQPCSQERAAILRRDGAAVGWARRGCTGSGEGRELTDALM